MNRRIYPGWFVSTSKGSSRNVRVNPEYLHGILKNWLNEQRLLQLGFKWEDIDTWKMEVQVLSSYPNIGMEEAELAVGWLAWILIFEAWLDDIPLNQLSAEISDFSGLSGNEWTPVKSGPLKDSFKKLREETIKGMSEQWKSEFREYFKAYFFTFEPARKERAKNQVMGIHAYQTQRRNSSAMLIQIHLMERLYHEVLPIGLEQLPSIVELRRIAADIAAWSRDFYVFSYHLEQLSNYRLLLAIREDKKLLPKPSDQYAIQMIVERISDFNNKIDEIRKDQSIQKEEVESYLQKLGAWTYGNDDHAWKLLGNTIHLRQEKNEKDSEDYSTINGKDTCFIDSPQDEDSVWLSRKIMLKIPYTQKTGEWSYAEAYEIAPNIYVMPEPLKLPWYSFGEENENNSDKKSFVSIIEGLFSQIKMGNSGKHLVERLSKRNDKVGYFENKEGEKIGNVLIMLPDSAQTKKNNLQFELPLVWEDAFNKKGTGSIICIDPYITLKKAEGEYLPCLAGLAHLLCHSLQSLVGNTPYGMLTVPDLTSKNNYRISKADIAVTNLAKRKIFNSSLYARDKEIRNEIAFTEDVIVGDFLTANGMTDNEIPKYLRNGTLDVDGLIYKVDDPLDPKEYIASGKIPSYDSLLLKVKDLEIVSSHDLYYPDKVENPVIISTGFKSMEKHMIIDQESFRINDLFRISHQPNAFSGQFTSQRSISETNSTDVYNIFKKTLDELNIFVAASVANIEMYDTWFASIKKKLMEDTESILNMVQLSTLSSGLTDMLGIYKDLGSKESSNSGRMALRVIALIGIRGAPEVNPEEWIKNAIMHTDSVIRYFDEMKKSKDRNYSGSLTRKLSWIKLVSKPMEKLLIPIIEEIHLRLVQSIEVSFAQLHHMVTYHTNMICRQLIGVQDSTHNVKVTDMYNKAKKELYKVQDQLLMNMAERLKPAMENGLVYLFKLLKKSFDKNLKEESNLTDTKTDDNDGEAMMKTEAQTIINKAKKLWPENVTPLELEGPKFIHVNYKINDGYIDYAEVEWESPNDFPETLFGLVTIVFEEFDRFQNRKYMFTEKASRKKLKIIPHLPLSNEETYWNVYFTDPVAKKISKITKLGYNASSYELDPIK
ncbi:terpene synthase family protein [Chryseobacterium piperi]|nr:hypothetical protein [Chryseobacterium piperi]